MYLAKESNGLEFGRFPTRADAFCAIVAHFRTNALTGELTMQHVQDDTHVVNYFENDECVEDYAFYIQPV